MRRSDTWAQCTPWRYFVFRREQVAVRAKRSLKRLNACIRAGAFASPTHKPNRTKPCESFISSCVPTEIILKFTLDFNITNGDKIALELAGFTSGECDNTEGKVRVVAGRMGGGVGGDGGSSKCGTSSSPSPPPPPPPPLTPLRTSASVPRAP